MAKEWNKGNITLQIRIPIKIAVSILGRLYGSGVLTREQYLYKLSQINDELAEKEKKKQEKLDSMLNKVKTPD